MTVGRLCEAQSSCSASSIQKPFMARYSGTAANKPVIVHGGRGLDGMLVYMVF